MKAIKLAEQLRQRGVAIVTGDVLTNPTGILPTHSKPYRPVYGFEPANTFDRAPV